MMVFSLRRRAKSISELEVSAQTCGSEKIFSATSALVKKLVMVSSAPVVRAFELIEVVIHWLCGTDGGLTMDQPRFFNLEEQLTHISACGDPLETLERTVNFEAFRSRLVAGLDYGDDARRVSSYDIAATGRLLPKRSCDPGCDLRRSGACAPLERGSMRKCLAVPHTAVEAARGRPRGIKGALDEYENTPGSVSRSRWLARTALAQAPRRTAERRPAR